MRSIRIARSLAVALLTSIFVLGSPSLAQTQAPNWAAVDQALGRAGTTQPDGVRRYGFPRSDLHVVLDGVTIKPALALGGWLAFQPIGTGAVVMGDLVLTPQEVNPVMAELLKGGLHVTAVHNHLLRSSPETIYMHVEGRGDAARLATALHAALALSHTPLAVPPAPAAAAALDLDTAAMDRTIGRPGKANGGVYQFTFPRAETIMQDGMAEGPSMGTATGICDRPSQPHDRRAADDLLHALLGRWASVPTRNWPSSRTRQDECEALILDAFAGSLLSAANGSKLRFG